MDLTLDSVGSHKSRSGQEEHLYNPLTIHLLQEAARTGSYDTFKEYTAEVDRDDKTYHLRSLMDFKFPEDGGIPLDQVEGVDSMAGNITNELVGKLGMKNLSKGVKVDVTEEHVSVDLSLNIRYGYNIPSVSEQVQEKVSTAIENMTGLTVLDVNVKIAGVNMDEGR